MHVVAVLPAAPKKKKQTCNKSLPAKIISTLVLLYSWQVFPRPDMRKHNMEELSAAENPSVHEKHDFFEPRGNSIREFFGTCLTSGLAAKKIAERLDFRQGRFLALAKVMGYGGLACMAS